MAVWEPLVAPLLDLGFQIIRYDLPGRGHTPLEGLGANFQAHIDQLHHLLDGLDLRQPVGLLGLASGALIVAAYTIANRARVSHVCLIAPDGAGTRFTLTERLLSTPLGTFLFGFTARRTLFARVPRYSTRADIQAFARNLLNFSLHSPGFREAVLETVRTFPLHHGAEHYLRLSKSGAPTCIIWGREDYITPPNAEGTRSAIFGEGSLHILENVGHLPFVEDPATVATLLEHHFRNAP
jgi:pimeloyl-ACP methyl ester carboxylesterase